MSTDRKRLTSAIQRIAREDPDIRELLKDYRNSGGKPAETASSGSGAEDRQTCCDGSSSGNSNPGSGTRDASEGGQDASDGLGDDPADISDMGPGSLSGVKDCSTDEPICFEGSDWIPPEGWDAPTDPPIAQDYEEGSYWYNDNYAMSGLAPGSLCAAIHPLTTTGDREYAYYERFGEDVSCVGINPISGSVQSFAILTLETCDGESVCDDPVPREEAWPEDGCVNIAQKGGKLVGSKFDPENDGSYSKPRNSIELCDDFGNSLDLAPSASGGWKTISSQNPGDGYLYNSSGEQIARISGSEFSDPNV